MAFCLWITGLPGSGKTTVVNALLPLLAEAGIPAVPLHLDRLRKILTPDPAYTEEERGLVYRALAVMAHLLVEKGGKNVVIDATANRRAFRDLARSLIPAFAEVHIACPLELCAEREGGRHGQLVEKELYRKAQKGELQGGLPGVSAPYEPPDAPEVRIDSTLLPPSEAAREILAFVVSKWYAPDGKSEDE